MARRLGRSSSFAIMLWIQPACLLSLIFSAHIAAVSIKHLLNGSDHDTDVGEQKDIFEINLAAGLNLFQGDILLPRTRNAMRDPSSRWKLPIPYILADNLELNAKGAILHAFEMFRLKSCVDFKPYEGESSYIIFQKLSGCWSMIGDQQVGQNISIGEGCDFKATIEHEILHALGFFHEQSRTDRDDYVNIWWDQIITDYEHNFNTYDDNTITDLNTPYDYESLMHYGPFSFNKNESIPTITTKIPEFNTIIGQLPDFSAIDLIRLNRMYNCTATHTLLDHCDFEKTNVCGMIQGTRDDADWAHGDSSQPEQVDHTLVGQCKGAGYFMFFNTSLGARGEAALLESRILYPKRKQQCLQFFYKMTGSPADRFEVWVRRDDNAGKVRQLAKIQTFQGDSDHNWKIAHVTLNEEKKFRYVFLGTKGDPGNSSGGIYLDDITLTETPCPAGVWTIRNISQILENTVKGDKLVSPRFYNSEGYGVGVTLYPNGRITSNSGFLGLTFHLYSGDNDAILEWPVENRQAIMTILDQEADTRNRMSLTLMFTTSKNQTSSAINGSVIWDRPSKVGVYDKDCDCFRSLDWGWGQAISHQLLKRRNFLKGDSLIIFVEEKGHHILRETELHVSDVDTDVTHISFTLTQAPKHGHMQISGRPLHVGGQFHLEDIKHGRISYWNSGDESLTDSCSLEVSDRHHVVPITLRVNVRPGDREGPMSVLPAGTLESYLDVLENGATEVTANIIKGAYQGTDDLMLTFLLEGPPSYGEILVNGAPAEQFTQRDILEGSVVYAHTSGEIGLLPKADSFNLSLSAMSQEWRIGSSIVQGVTVWVTILPVDSQAPEISLGEQFVVLEGDKSVISLTHLSAEDMDSLKDDLLCTIVIQPTSGYVENISPAPGSEKSRAGVAISAFTLKDLRQGHINYVQSVHRGVEPVEDRFIFRCSDGINFSERQIFPIVIIPTNDEQPEMFMREFMVMEGMSLVVNRLILNAADADIPRDDLTFTITRFPTHGHVMNQLINGTVLVESFTLDQIIESSSIIYEHDDSETQEDSFVIKLTDGKHSVEKMVLIVVIPVDDETPRMTINNGLEIEIGETKVINNKVLMATDLDSDDKSLVYIIRYGPGHGLLQRQKPLGAFENITLGMNFTQDEVDRNLIQYVHFGQEGIRDLIKFDVTDGTNALIDRYFYVTIGSVDIVFPDVVSKGVSLKEGGKVTLTTDLLSTSDLNSPDENLVFTITRAPMRGHLECTDRRGLSITSFTQLQLAGNKIYYIHTAEDEVKMDSFEFQVTDGRNPVFRTFRISISDVDNKKPVVTIHNLVVSESESKLITPFELTVEDRDTPDRLLKFIVTQVPVHGHLLFNNTRSVMVFTKQDLNENLISYKHDGTESTEDSFSFTVTDGTHSDFYVFPDTVFETRRPQVMKIQVLPVDNSVPQIVVNKGASTLRTLATGHLGFMITSKILKVEDRDSLHFSLRFIVTEAPQHGYLLNLGQGNHSVTQFTQADIDDMKICYVLRERANATSDMFHFIVEDDGGNRLTNQHFRLNWAWISFEKEYYLINEDSKFLDIVLTRRGYLGETSFISIGTRDGTAEKDRDFKGKAQKQVQFNPGQTRASWRVRILSDGEHEHSETFQVVLSEPVLAILEFPTVTTVEIIDPGDESTVFIPQSEYSVEEDVGELFIPIRRSGDISRELMVICYTQQGTATSTVRTSVLSYSDYISRPEDHSSVIRFDKDEREKMCRILVIDDSLYEEEETFQVLLSMPMGGRIGDKFPGANVTILTDRDDEPAFYFGDTQYSVDESAGYVELQVWRTGTDLSKPSSVTVRSRKTESLSADAGTDYVGISRNLDFAPGVNMQTVRVVILDDLGRPILEGIEKFELVLRMPMNAALGEPSKATVSINDSASDLPKMQFKERVYTCNENDGRVVAMIYRSGDIQHRSSVRCYTRQGSAQVMMDFEERPNTDVSTVTFLPGEMEKPCVLELMDDAVYEDVEELRLVLGTPQGSSAFGAAVGEQNETLIKIQDEADKAVIKFGETKFSVTEPSRPGESVVVKIPVIRQGDTSKVSIVRVHTKDGSATSGEDYHPVSEEIEFKEGETQHTVEIEVIFDGVREMREAFTVHLKPDENMVAETQATKAIVYIEEIHSMADVTFPSVPHIVSLLIYDDPSKGREDTGPVSGYPVVCITACNPKYPDYEKTGSICASENINDTLTRYRWLISAPAGPDGVTSPMREVDFDTFFTSSKMITLDSIYFQPGSRVQCAARAVNTNGNEGLELMSPIVTIGREEGLCQPRVPGVVGAEPFSAKLRYTGPEDPDFANLIKLTVTMPHIDGMLPAISTRELSNFELTLSPDGTRVGNHKCSNLLDYNEVKTHHGFLTNATKNPEVIGETYPYQYSVPVRGSSTLRFYRNLNLEACLWEFVSYYDMTELLADCGGTIGTDGQVLNLVQSYVTLRVPLYVSYVFHSPVGVGGWQHFDLKSELRLTFVYDTAILWNHGIGSPPEAELQGSLYPTSMRIGEEGRLAVNFKTEAQFHGLFVLSHPASFTSSLIVSADHPGLTFSLRLIRSEPTYNQPVQQWSFVSDFAVRDYSGTYTVKLVPCTTPSNQEYRLPVTCNPREPVTFDLDIRFQQVSDPVATEFSLNTHMYLLSKKNLWLSDGSMGFGQESDVAFAEGDVIYGRVMVDPVQNLGDSFYCSIEKVFLCTGDDGYVPKYSPANAEYGCLADSPSLLHRFKIVDKAQPETQATSFGDVLFNAKLAVDDPEAVLLVNQPGSDGFKVDSTPLFQVALGREWYIHTIYTVKSKDNTHRGIGKRSLEYQYHSVVHPGPPQATTKSWKKRAVRSTPSLAGEIGAENNRGTNIQHISLNRRGKRQVPHGRIPPDGILPWELNSPSSEVSLVTVLGGLTVGLLTVCLAVAAAVMCRNRSTKGKDTPKGSGSTEPMMSPQSHYNDSSEV